MADTSLPPGFRLNAVQAPKPSQMPPPLPPGFFLDRALPKGDRLKNVPSNLPQADPWNEQAADIFRSVGSNLVTGTEGLFGLPGDIASWVGGRTADAVGAIPGVSLSPDQKQQVAGVTRALTPAGWFPTTPEIDTSVNKVTGFTPYTPMTTPGRYAGSVAGFVPAATAAAATGGVTLPMALLGAGTAGVGSQAGGDIAAGEWGEDKRPYGEMVGALVGGFGPSALRRVVTPFPATAARTAAVDALAGEGVTDLTAGQRTGNNSLRYFESEVGGPRVAETSERQGEQFTQAVLSRAGIQANRATPDVIDHAFTRIGDEFDALAKNNTLTPDQQLGSELNSAWKDYDRLVAAPNQVPAVRDYMIEVRNQVGKGGGVIDGAAYQSLRSRMAADARNSTDPYVKQALNDMVGALDDGMERSIAASNPGDLGAWRDARSQYRNMLVIERAATGGGEQAAAGLITPAQLRTATQSVTGRRAYARGNTPFDELARAGTTVMSPLPNSGTAGRAAARTVLGSPALVGALLGAKQGAGEMWATLAGATGGAAVSAALRRALMSPTGREIIANQIFSRPMDPRAVLAPSLVGALDQSQLTQPPPILGYDRPFPAITH